MYDDDAVTQDDALDVVEFLDYLLKYLFTIPHNIKEYRNRRTVAPSVNSAGESPTKNTD